jgi:HAD superfamily hydrolase (TIGR01490 family)
MGLVFVDFDGTLTTRDTTLPFGFFLARRRPRRYARMVHLIWLIMRLKLRTFSNHTFKEKVCGLLLKGESEVEIGTISEEFARHYVAKSLNGSVAEAMRAHQMNGDDVYLVSSNFAVLLRPLQRAWSLSGVIATDPEVRSGRFTGRLCGQACDGPEKLSRVVARFGRERVREATAYGDRRSDRYLLSVVSRAVWV